MVSQRPAYAFARRNGVLLLGWNDDGKARVAWRQPGELHALSEIRRYLRAPIEVQKVAAEQFDQLLEQTYAEGTSSASEIAADVSGDLDLNALADNLPEPEDLLESEDDAPIIRLINAILTQAVKEQASDVHIEPDEQHLVVRFRVDGVLHEVMRPARSLASLIVSRIKVMAELDIAEKRLPQDGRIGLRIAGRPVDVRVSTLPAGRGERVVLRLLDKQAGRMDLQQLGMDATTLQRARRLISRPHGIILVTGPTGSGKTTTLYAMLSELNDRSRNIMTVEDPVEYQLEGIAQTQVNARIDLTFARGLRAILRQDPDVVMVGEIRDLETARIAVQASLTGHLVLSTLHTNSAIGAITRLVDMGIEPFLLSASLIGVLAQRLVRQLEPQHCERWQASVEELQQLGLSANQPAELWRPQADLPAGVSGYHGRLGLYELVQIDDGMRQLIHDQAGEQAMTTAARQQTPALADDGWHKALAGRTSLEEVLRVTRVE
ncbi:MAG: GspE family T2SS ATPase variant XcpR [Wenzhouxiangellaceae bacterium]